jgi:2-dehydro-3-deoxygluconokinase
VQVVCIGESMATLVPEAPGPLETVERFQRGVGGAESNVACGLAALGVPAAWISRVGDDGFGRLLREQLSARGVDTSAVEVDPHRATGLYVKEIGGRTGSPHDLGPEISRLHYYRTGSAASAIGPQTLAAPAAAALLDAARVVHLSGITAALGRLSGQDGGRRLFESMLERRRPGQLVSFDLNWRPRVWQGPDPQGGPEGSASWPESERPAEILAGLAARADIVLLGTDEAAEVFGTDDPQRLRALFPGPRILVVKDSSRGTTAFERNPAGEAGDTNAATGDDVVVTEPALRVDVVEPVGAGDAFAAGYISGLLSGLDQRRRLRLGHVCAASVLMVNGDHCTPPGPELLRTLLDCTPSQWSATTAAGGAFTVPANTASESAAGSVPQ